MKTQKEKIEKRNQKEDNEQVAKDEGRAKGEPDADKSHNRTGHLRVGCWSLQGGFERRPGLPERCALCICIDTRNPT